jgi:hypothetical protein
MRTIPDPFAGPIHCDGCHHCIWWPRWAPNGDGAYWCLCDRCHYQRERQFTPENAIAQALALVAFEHATLSGRVVCDGGGL